MPVIDMSNVKDADSFEPVPRGRYKVSIIDEPEVVQTKNNDDMWKTVLTIQEGEYTGRKIFDNLVFSEKAMGIVKKFSHSIGFDVTGEIDINPLSIMDKPFMVTVDIGSYRNLDSGEERKKNVVIFAGYDSIESINDIADAHPNADVDPGEPPF